MSTPASAFVTHLQVRLRATVQDPAAATVLILAALSTLLLWPGTVSPGELGLQQSFGDDLLMWLLWLFLWPALPMSYLAGKVTGRGLDSSFSQRAMLSLPVGIRTRALAEATLLLATVLLCHLGKHLLSADARLGTGGSVFEATAVMLPLCLAWGLPTGSLGLYKLRPALVALLLLAARQLGLLSQTSSLLVVVSGITALVLASAHVEPRLPDMPGRRRRLGLHRVPEKPNLMLSRDVWQYPLRTWGVPTAAALTALYGAVILEADGRVPAWSVFAVCEGVLIVLMLLAFRPFDSKLLAMALLGRFGAHRGDFLRAFCVLPVRPEAVLRRVWVFAFCEVASLCALLLGALVLRTWLRFSELGLRAADGGDLTMVLLPFSVLVPMLSGFVTATAAGDRTKTLLSGGAIFSVVYVHLMLFAFLRYLLGPSSPVPVLVDAVFLVVVMLTASVPPLTLLRTPRS